MKRKLSYKQQRFVTEYLKDQNAMQAAIRAGYSEKGAGVQGHHLLKNPKVKTAVDKAMQEAQNRTKEKLHIDRELVTKMLIQDREFARRNQSATAAVSATTAIAKLHGLFIDRRLLGIRNIDDMSEEEILEFLGGEPGSEELSEAASPHAPGHA